MLTFRPALTELGFGEGVDSSNAVATGKQLAASQLNHPMTPPNRNEPTNYIAYLESIGYLNVLHANDTYVGLYPLMFTLAIVYDLHDWGYTERYCFEDPSRAKEELMKWYITGFDEDHIVTGFIASRGVKRPNQPSKEN